MYIQTLFLIFSLAFTLLFFLYGFNHYFLLKAARHYKPPQLPQDLEDRQPRVAIHLPVYNEKYVVDRIVTACAVMADHYGADRVSIVIVDDSDDETIEVIDRIVSYYKEKNFDIKVLRRSNRQGFKAGALEAALEGTDEDYIAVFDADFNPPPDFLVRSMPYFLQNERLGIIQGRWTHINNNYNFLTRAIATGIDVHFLIEQPGRYAAGCFQNFNGSGGIIRKQALILAGGWQSDSLAEDLDASYRIQMLGYRIMYLRDLQCPGEIPPTLPSYKKQQGRWANGSLRTAKKLLPRLIFNRNFGIKQRVEALIHLTSYLVHPLMLASFMLACMAALLRVDIFSTGKLISSMRNMVLTGELVTGPIAFSRYLAWSLAGGLIVVCTIAAWIPPLTVLKAQPISFWRKLSSIGILFFLGFGVNLNNSIEAGKALFSNRNWDFKRTPKYAVLPGNGRWQEKTYQVPLDFVSILEFILICLGLTSIGYSIENSNLGVLFILVPFTAAYGFVFLFTMLQSRPKLKP